MRAMPVSDTLTPQFWRTALWVLLALLPLWLGGMFGRDFWTPDEPREADVAWNMSQQADPAIPLMAGEPFLEKPPLLYWAAAPGIALPSGSWIVSSIAMARPTESG